MSKQIGIHGRIIVVVASAAFVLSWGSGFVIAKVGTGTAPTLTVLFWRYLAVALLLLSAAGVFALRRRARRLPAVRLPRWRDIRPHLGIGFFAQFGYIVPIYLAIAAGVSAGTTALIDAVQPMVVATLVGPLLGLRVRAVQWVGLVLGAAGVALIVGADVAASASTTPAYLLPLVSLASLVAGTFLDRRTHARLSVFATLSVHSAVTLVAVALLAGATGNLVPPASIAFWATTAFTAVVPTVIAYALYWYLLRRIGITALNALLYLVAPTVAVAGTLLFAEPFTAATVGGLVLGAAAVALVIAPPRRRDHSVVARADYEGGDVPLMDAAGRP